MSLQDFREVAKAFGWNPEGDIPLVNFIAGGLKQAAEAEKTVTEVKALLVRAILGIGDGGVQPVYGSHHDNLEPFSLTVAPKAPTERTGMVVLLKKSQLKDRSLIGLELFEDQQGNIFVSAKETFGFLKVAETIEEAASEVAPMPAPVE